MSFGLSLFCSSTLVSFSVGWFFSFTSCWSSVVSPIISVAIPSAIEAITEAKSSQLGVLTEGNSRERDTLGGRSLSSSVRSLRLSAAARKIQQKNIWLNKQAIIFFFEKYEDTILKSCVDGKVGFIFWRRNFFHALRAGRCLFVFRWRDVLEACFAGRLMLTSFLWTWFFDFHFFRIDPENWHSFIVFIFIHIARFDFSAFSCASFLHSLLVLFHELFMRKIIVWWWIAILIVWWRFICSATCCWSWLAWRWRNLSFWRWWRRRAQVKHWLRLDQFPFLVLHQIKLFFCTWCSLAWLFQAWIGVLVSSFLLLFFAFIRNTQLKARRPFFGRWCNLFLCHWSGFVEESRQLEFHIPVDLLDSLWLWSRVDRWRNHVENF